MCLSPHTTCQPRTGSFLRPEAMFYSSPSAPTPFLAQCLATACFPKQLLSVENVNKPLLYFYQFREKTHPWFHSKSEIPIASPAPAPRPCSVKVLFSTLLGSQRGQTLDFSHFPTKATGKGVYGLAANQGHKHFNRSQSDPVICFEFHFFSLCFSYF